MTFDRAYKVASNPAKRAARKKRTAAAPIRRKKKTMAKRARAPRRSASSAAPRRKNPARRTRAKSTHRRRNPNSVGRAGSLAAEGATALVAMVATRQVPQMLLGTSNVGWMGYAANIATAAAASFAAKKFAGPRAGNAAAIGGACGVVYRVITEQLSPIGQYLALTGVGDASAATKLGTIEDAYYTFPNNYDAQGKPVIPRQIIEAAQAGMQPRSNTPAPASMGGAINSQYAQAYSRY